MAVTLAICNQKGGVGKTTTAVNLGACLAKAGKRTLLVDLDSQGNATSSSGAKKSSATNTLYDILLENAPIKEAVLEASIKNLFVLPASIELAGADIKLSQLSEREHVVKSALESMASEYDAILFDCPPSLGLLTVNALAASDYVLIPVQCEYLALEGLTALLRSIELVKKELHPNLRVGGIVLTMTDFRAKLTKEIAEEVRNFFKELVFRTTIPRNVRLAESPSFGTPICEYDARSVGALSYQALAQEVIAKLFSTPPGEPEQTRAGAPATARAERQGATTDAA